MAQASATESPDEGASRPRSTLRRTLELSWIVTVVLFTLARLLVARETLAQYGLNVWVFGVIDLVTAFPYALGTAKVVEGIVDRDNRAIGWWALIAAGAFLAPYAYVAWAGTGGEFPAAVYVVLGVLILIFGANAVWSVVRKARTARLAKALETEDGLSAAARG